LDAIIATHGPGNATPPLPPPPPPPTHIIEALERSSSFFPVLATIQKSRKPSETSLSDIESKVDGVLYKIDNAISKIESENGKISKFEKIAKEENYFVRTITIDDNSPKIDYRSGINYSKAQTDFLRLAYGEESKVGSICSAPIFDKNKYIIAILANIKEKGEPKYEDVKERMEKDILIDKKAKKMISEMSKTKNLASLASLYKTSVIDTSVTFSAMNIGNFSEPEIIGSLFSLIKDGQTTLPLKGSMGVYVIKVNNTLKAPAGANNKAERDELLNRYKSNAMRLAIDGLEKAAEVVDNRALFFASIRL
jgi:peptidyl-prolyl cis-trans isomerase D